MSGALAMAVHLIGSCEVEGRRRVQRSGQACKPAHVLSADNGVAACSDGRVFRWREGYTVPVGVVTGRR